MAAWLHTILTPSEETTVTLTGEQHSPALEISEGTMAISIRLSPSDDDAELFLDQFQATIDNARSIIGLRRLHHERVLPGETVVGWDGAGSDVDGVDYEVGRG